MLKDLFAFPTSFSQQRLWFLDQLNPGTSLYNVSKDIQFQGQPDLAAIKAALQEVVSRHDILRTTFSEIDGRPYQLVSSRVDFSFQQIDLRLYKAKRKYQELERLTSEEAARPFDLSLGPLFRAMLLLLSNEESLLFVTMHHIITDGWSMELLGKELTALYEAFRNGKTSPLTPLPLQYSDYAVWQNSWFKEKNAGEQLSYWKEKLANLPPMALPWDRPHPAEKSLAGAMQAIVISRRLSQLALNFSRKEGVTLFMTLLAAFQVTLARISSLHDILVGTPVAGRSRTELESLIGFFVNILPLRIALNGNPTLREVVHRAEAVAMEAFAHQDIPFDQVVSELSPDRSLASNPIVDVIFALQNVDGLPLTISGLENGDEEDEEENDIGEVNETTAKFDLIWSLIESEDGISGQIEYSTALLDAETVHSWITIYKRVLEVMVTAPETSFENFSLLSPEQQVMVVEDWNQTDFDYPRHASLGALFSEQVGLFPDSIAVVYGKQTVRYKELDDSSFALAQRLFAAGVEPGDRVGVCLSPSVDWVVSLLAIIRCGAAYVPLDPQYPEERIRLLSEDAGIKLILTPVVLQTLEPAVSVKPLPAINSEAIAYVMYTSGSTGRPKGVTVPHRAIVRLVYNTNYIAIDPGDRIGQVSSVGFDAATFEIWGALLNGATLVGIDRNTVLSPQHFAECLSHEKITAMFVTSALFNQVARDVPAAFASLKYLLFGGDAADVHAIRSVMKAGKPEYLINAYGPTETTTFAAFYEVTTLEEKETTIPIGEPIGNTQVYVLDERMQLQPVSVPGELYIGGDGLATGYLNAPEQTAASFVEDPFRKGGRLYRTGDLAKYRYDGAIVFLGRKDHQVKIRGFRVEPGEIESVLLSNDAVREVIVQPFSNNGSPKQLAGYIVWENGMHLSVTELRSWITESLPEYMVPAVWIEMEALPLNNNGKVNRLALPLPDSNRPEIGVLYQEPKSRVEKEIASIWSELIKIEKVGVNDNFFELGGHSLLATQVISRIRQRLGVELPVRIIFQRPTIAALANYIELVEPASASASPLVIGKRAGTGPAPLSFSQQRLWFLDQLDPDSSLYNIHSVLYIDGDLNLDALEHSIETLLLRHEVLRTRFATLGGVPVQLVNAPAPFALKHTNLSSKNIKAAEREYERIATSDAKLPFDLEKGPLFRAQVVTVDTGDHRLVMTMHHVISDGWSLGVLHHEIGELYSAYSAGREPSLPKLQIQYTDFSVWQRQQLQGDELAQLLSWWRTYLAGAPHMINLPTDFPRPLVQKFMGATQTKMIDDNIRKQMEEIGRREGATLFMTLLTVWYVLLCRFSGEDDIVIGTPIANRTRSELESLIGFFVNTLLIRLTISGNPTFRELLRNTRDAANGAYAHQDLPFERLVAELAPERRLSHTPLFQCFFALQQQPSGSAAAFKHASSGPVLSTSMFDLSLTMLDFGYDLAASFEYSTELFGHHTVTCLMGQLERLLAAIVLDPDKPIFSYNLLSEDEREQVLFEWNNTSAPYPKATTVLDFFVQRAAANPDAIAVIGENTQLTYNELNSSANRLAQHLSFLGLEPGAIIGFALQQNPQMLITMFGILMAGCAYVPLDPAYPKRRLSQIISSAKLSAIITTKELATNLPLFSGTTILLDEEQVRPATCQPKNLSGAVKADGPAYVIHTSGSTGEPKGVLIGHRSLLNYTEAAVEEYGITKKDRVLQFASVNFDASVEEIFPVLTRGGTLILRTESMMTSIADFFARCEEYRISVISLPTAFWHEVVSRMVADKLPLPSSLRLVIIGGDRALPDRVNAWQNYVQGRVALINTYGPTEATVVSTMFSVNGKPVYEGELPIGRPVRNARTYVLDAYQQPVPVGVRGELWIAGDGLAKGYLHNQELTSKRFLKDPFTSLDGERMYRSGDLVRWLPGGVLEFCGRTDRQVKIRGYRIELGEIENVLQQHEAVKESVVVAHEDAKGNKRLIAYLVQDTHHQQEEDTSRSQQVGAWEAVFDDLYAEVDAAQQDAFYIKGWDSSYTGLPIPPDEVKAWMDQTVTRILLLQPQHVREIGCGGSGLMLFRIAPHCKTYTGTDLSENALQILQRQLEKLPVPLQGVRLLHKPAHLQELEPGSIDALLIVSVAQYFPTIDYLIEVLENAVEGIVPGGFIFIGDVRNYALLEAFHTSVQLFKASPSTPVTELKERVKKHMLAEKQLTLDPAFFYALTRRIPKITAVEIKLLRGRNENELTRFRYDVILHIGKIPARSISEWQQWNPEIQSLTSLRHSLMADLSTVHAFINIPNARILNDARAVQLLAMEDGPATVEEIKKTWQAESKGIDPEDLWNLAGELGLEVEITWPGHSSDGAYDAVFHPAGSQELIASRIADAPIRSWNAYANDPTQKINVRKLVPELRSFLSAQLPAYMVPSQLIVLEALPLTPTGKIDRKSLPKPDRERTDLEDGFEIPRTTIEETLTQIWKEILDLDKVGIHDNFFELGGDSILSIQVIARAKEAGLRFTPKQLFQHQTIAELAAVAGSAEGIFIEQGTVTGAVPLTPIQHWFFKANLPHMQTFTQSAIFDLDDDVELPLIRTIVDELQNAHDALRLRFVYEEEKWHQFYVDAGAFIPVIEIDLASWPDAAEGIEATTQKLQQGLQISTGPIARVALLKGPGKGQRRLLLVAHHLVVDGVSWRILQQDVATILEQTREGKALQLPPKTTSFKYWANSLENYAQSSDAEQALSFWVSQLTSSQPQIPLDFYDRLDAHDKHPSWQVSLLFTAEETRELLHDVPKAYRTQINDILLAALAQALSAWTGQRSVLLDLEGHGREPIFDTIDLSRTVGWFTSVYPVQLNLPPQADSLGEVLRSVKEQLRKYPAKGLLYGVLKYLSQNKEIITQIDKLPQPQVCFNYLGQFGVVRLAAEQEEVISGTDASGESSIVSTEIGQGEWGATSHILDINGGVENGQLWLSWAFSTKFHRPETIETLARRFAMELRRLILHCKSAEARTYSPSDFPLADLDQEKLNWLIGSDKGVEDIYPLSPMQEGMLFHSIYDPDAGEYVEQSISMMPADLQVKAFQDAWKLVVERHSILRTGFAWSGLEAPLQIVRHQVDLSWQIEDWSEFAPEDVAEMLDNFLEKDRIRGFELTDAPLMRFALLKTSDNDWIFVWTSHHILLDGWSQPIVLSELYELYKSIVKSEQARLTPVRPFRHYIEWLLQQDLSKAEAFWRQTLQGFVSATPLMVGENTNITEDEDKEYMLQEIAFSPADSVAIDNFIRRTAVTGNTAAQAVWALILSRYSSEGDVVFGAAVSGRPADLQGVEQMVGLFINTLPVRIRINEEISVGYWLKEIQRQQINAKEFEHTPLVEIQGWSEIERGSSLFDSLFVFENYPDAPSFSSDEEYQEPVEYLEEPMVPLERTNYPVTIAVIPGHQWVVRITYDAETFTQDSIRRMLEHFRNVLTSFAKHPEQPVSKVELLTAREQQQIKGWNNTVVDWNPMLLAHKYVEDKAAIQPNAIAIDFFGEQTSYETLNQKANQLAHRILSLNLPSPPLVALYLERSVALTVSVLGILKAGSGYVPLDTTYPAERLAYMLHDSGARILLTQRHLIDRLPASVEYIWVLDDIEEELQHEKVHNPDLPVLPDAIAYVIYTSGSTGKPKGVAMPHGPLANLVHWQITASTPRPGTRTLQFAPISFDVHFQEMFSTWASGGTIVLITEKLRRDMQLLLQHLITYKVDRLFLPFVALKQLAEIASGAPLPLMREVITAGEQLKIAPVIRNFFDNMPEASLHNHYGPSESHVVTAYQLPACTDDWLLLPPIGKPIANARIYLLNERMQLVPVGVPAQIYIGGDVLALGYLNKPEITAERFISDPFSTDPSARLYATGDLARYRSDGNIEFLGRVDFQVKIRGFRVELGELEIVLGQHPAIQDCAVAAWEDTYGDKKLVAYIISNEQTAPSTEELRSFLFSYVPDYMVPSVFVSMSSLPTTPSGKIDRRSLPAPDFMRSGLEGQYQPPRDYVEEKLATIYADVLQIDKVGITDNFFDLGGHSLMATRIISRIRDAFHVELPLRSVFEAPSVAAMGNKVSAACAVSLLEQKIPHRRQAGTCPLSYAQQRLWFLEQLQPGTSMYNVHRIFHFENGIKPAAIEAAVNEIVRRHESLRTTFVSVEGKPYQFIAACLRIDIPVHDLRRLSQVHRREKYLRILAELTETCFDLKQGPLLQAALLRFSRDYSILIVVMHHIITDGWSMEIFARELEAFCSASSTGKAITNNDLPIQYADYAAWQRQRLDGETSAVEMKHCLERFSGMPSTIELPFDYQRPAVPSFRGTTIAKALPNNLAQRIAAFSREQRVTPYTTLLAGFNALLARLSGSYDIVVGTPSSGRTHTELENLIGFFVNTLVIRTDLSGNPTLEEVLHRVETSALAAFDGQVIPFDRIVTELAPERHLSLNPLVQVMFALQNVNRDELDRMNQRSDGNDESFVIEASNSKFDLTLTILASDEAFESVIEFSTDLLSVETVQRWHAFYMRTLEVMVNGSGERLETFPLLTPAEHDLVLRTWNNTRRPFPEHATLYELFYANVLSCPNQTAVVYGQNSLTFYELNQLAIRVAAYLLTNHIAPGDRVAVMMRPSPEWIAVLLGIIHCGAVYVPLDNDCPAERLRYIQQDAAVRLTITDLTLTEESLADLPLESGTPAPCSADSIAYIIYTSGSTGQPKGVMVPHRAIVNLVYKTNYVSLTPHDCVAQISNPAFDAATFEIWAPLLNGATIVGIDRDIALSPLRFAEVLSQTHVSVLFVTTALFNQIAREVPGAFATVDQVMFGGEAADSSAVAAILAAGKPRRILNMYGPTETTTFATFYEINDDNFETIIPIGFPVSNVEVYVLDSKMQLQPVGLYGEIYIGGSGVATGYLDEPALTAERFLQNPFGPGRMYKTGDIGRYRPDGAIEFYGRKDQQVKIRGFRVEMGEIESALLTHPAIREVLVQPWENGDGTKQLAAYTVFNDSLPVPVEQLRKWLKERLPAYMVPAYWMELPALPLTANGKIDRRALPSPINHRSNLETPYKAPATALQSALASVWSDILRIEKVGLQDNFFELGGHSLLAMQVVSRLRDALGIDVPVRLLFAHPTVEDLAIGLGEEKSFTDSMEQILPRSSSDSCPLSFAQQRIWFLEQIEPGTPLFNIQDSIPFSGLFSKKALEAALSELVRRHEILRTGFTSVDGVAMQIILPAAPVCIPVSDLTSMPRYLREDEFARISMKESQDPFQLSKAPLFRTRLIKLSSREHFLLITIHHIIIDGWSLPILRRELKALYESYREGMPSPLQELPVQYADFSIWQRNRATSPEIKAQIEYWKNKLAQLPPVLELPLDYQRPASESSIGARQSLHLTQDLSAAVYRLCQSEQATPFMVLLTAFQLVLHRYTGCADLLIGCPVAGRTHAEIENLIGCFLNTLPIRIDASGNPTFLELLRRVRKTSLDAFANQEVPYERLLQELAADRALHTQLFRLFFNVISFDQENTESSASFEEPGKPSVPVAAHSIFDLTLYVFLQAGSITMETVYRTSLFQDNTISRLLLHLQSVLSSAVIEPGRRLNSFNCSGDAEDFAVIKPGLANRHFEFAADEIEQSIGQRFEKLAGLYAEKIAVRTKLVQWTYATLHREARMVSNLLLRMGLQPGQRVLLLFNHDAPMLAALLGTLLAGGVYVPIDPSLPQERQLRMIEATNASCLLTDAANYSGTHNMDIPVYNLENKVEGDDLPLPCTSPDAPAYILYTSGSTGVPKGVIQNHRNVLHHCRTYSNALCLHSSDCIALISSYSFDAAVMDIYGALLNGATLSMFGIKEESPEFFAEWINKEAITIYHSTPTIYRYLLNNNPEHSFPGVRCVVLGGEEVMYRDFELYTKHFSDHCLLINGLGPTECTLALQYFMNHSSIISRNTVPVGYPVNGVEVILLDDNGEPISGCGTGELAFRSRYVAIGYWQDPGTTAQAFINDNNDAAIRFYRTGDLAHRLPDGKIEFRGRKDHQVKIRGIRIELGEIESRLLEHENIKETAVSIFESGTGDKHLVAYTVAKQSSIPMAADLRSFLRQRLPEVMLPSIFVSLDALPLTSNGKVNRNALPAPTENGRSESAFLFVAPSTPTEQALASIWSTLLRVTDVSVTDNFFEMGGHSLLVMQLASRVRENLYADLPLRQYFTSRTMGDLALLIDKLLETNNIQPQSAIPRVPRELYRVTFDETGGIILPHILM